MISSARISSTQWLHLASAVAMVISYFLPWVDWNGTAVSGAAMATGDFFSSSVAVSGPENPFPKLSFSFYIFWLIPLLGIVSAVLVILKKRTVPLSFVAGATGLALVSVYYLFSATLVDFGVGKSGVSMLSPGIYIHALAAVGLIATAYPVKNPLYKLGWILLGPVLAFASFKIVEKKLMSETHQATTDVKADFTVNADSLIREFIVNDSAANKKYLEKVLVVNGLAASVEIKPDSSSTIQFADSTGSYAIFSLEKDQLDDVKKISKGDPVSVKAVCSGSIFSDILGTTSINFKRSTLNKTKQQ